MRTLITLLLIHITWHSGAQFNQYHPFPEQDALWNVTSQGCCVTNCNTPPNPNPVLTDHEFSYYISGDTTISANLYSKIYRSGSVHEHCFSGSSVNNWFYENHEYFGGLRQDTSQRTVSFIPSSGTVECLLYDFNLAVGDTMQGNCLWPTDCAVISGIDSVLVGSTYRKRFNLSGAGTSYSLIEGIGSTSGLFEPLCPFEYSGDLVCFAMNGQAMYPDTATSCNNFTGLIYADEMQDLRVFPNPFISEFSVHISGPPTTGTWTMFDIQGRSIRTGLYTNSSFSIERGEIDAGMYHFTIMGKNGKYRGVNVLAQ
jgi:hypothetical protein